MHDISLAYLPRVGVQLLELSLVGCNKTSLLVEDKEARAGSALVDRPDKLMGYITSLLSDDIGTPMAMCHLSFRSIGPHGPIRPQLASGCHPGRGESKGARQ